MGGITIESEMKAKQDSREPSPSTESQFTYMIQEKYGGDFTTAFFLLETAGSHAEKDPEEEIFSIELVRQKPGFPDTTTRLEFTPFDKSLAVEVSEAFMQGSNKRIISTGSISYVREIRSVEVKGGHEFIIENGSHEIRVNGVDGTVDQR